MHSESATLMFREAAQAADAVAVQFERNAEVVAALAARLRREPPRFVVTCARGSSDHAATFAKYLFETRLGLVTASASPSVGSVYAGRPQVQGALYLLISQSGRSPDLLRNAEAARAGGACVVALVNDIDSPLAALAHVALPLHAGPERSVAATKSYLCSLAALLQLLAHWRGDDALRDALPELPTALSAAWRAGWTPLVDGLADARNLFVLGRGLGLGAVQEMALKLKETCGLHAEAYSAAEVRHGPMAIVGPGFPLLCLAQPDETEAGMREVVDAFRARGAQAWLAAVDGELPLTATREPAFAPLLAVQSFYRAANALALRRGFDPDVPPHLRKVTETL